MAAPGSEDLSAAAAPGKAWDPKLGGPFLRCCYCQKAFSDWRFLRRSSLSPWFPVSWPEMALWVTSSLWVELLLLSCPFGCAAPHFTLHSEALVSASESPLLS